MKNIFNLACAVATLFVCCTASADVRCWVEPDGFEECRNDPAYDRYKDLRDERGLISVGSGDISSDDLRKFFGDSLADEIKAKAAKSGKTVRQLVADKLLE